MNGSVNGARRGWNNSIASELGGLVEASGAFYHIRVHRACAGEAEADAEDWSEGRVALDRDFETIDFGSDERTQRTVQCGLGFAPESFSGLLGKRLKDPLTGFGLDDFSHKLVKRFNRHPVRRLLEFAPRPKCHARIPERPGQLGEDRLRIDVDWRRIRVSANGLDSVLQRNAAADHFEDALQETQRLISWRRIRGGARQIGRFRHVF